MVACKPLTQYQCRYTNGWLALQQCLRQCLRAGLSKCKNKNKDTTDPLVLASKNIVVITKCRLVSKLMLVLDEAKSIAQLSLHGLGSIQLV